MSTPQPPDRAALGRARLAERARHVARIRQRVVAATLAAFVLAWGLIVFDGPMGATTIASTTTSSGTTTSSSGSTSSDGSFSSSSDSSGTTTAPPAAVTTGQS
jgi:hypothetical protein